MDSEEESNEHDGFMMSGAVQCFPGDPEATRRSESPDTINPVVSSTSGSSTLEPPAPAARTGPAVPPPEEPSAAANTVTRTGATPLSELSRLSFDMIRRRVAEGREQQRERLRHQVGHPRFATGFSRVTDLDRAAFERTDHYGYQPRASSDYSETRPGRGRAQGRSPQPARAQATSASGGAAADSSTSGPAMFSSRRMANGRLMATFRGRQFLQPKGEASGAPASTSRAPVSDSRKPKATGRGPAEQDAPSAETGRPSKIVKLKIRRAAGAEASTSQGQRTAAGQVEHIPDDSAGNNKGRRQTRQSLRIAQPASSSIKRTMSDHEGNGEQSPAEQPAKRPRQSTVAQTRTPTARSRPETFHPASAPTTTLSQLPDIDFGAIVVPARTPAAPGSAPPNAAAPAADEPPSQDRPRRNNREEPPYEGEENDVLRALNLSLVGRRRDQIPTDNQLLDEFNREFEGRRLTYIDDDGQERLTRPRPRRTKAAITSHVRREGIWPDIKRIRSEGRSKKPGPKVGSTKAKSRKKRDEDEDEE